MGDYEAAVTLLLASPPGSATFYVDALRAVALSAAVSPAMQDLTVKVVAANMVQAPEPLAGIHLLCAVGRYQEACSQLQDGGRWVDACTLAATHLSGSDRARSALKSGNGGSLVGGVGLRQGCGGVSQGGGAMGASLLQQ